MTQPPHCGLQCWFQEVALAVQHPRCPRRVDHVPTVPLLQQPLGAVQPSGCHLSQPLCCFFPAQTDLYSGALFVQVCLGWDLYLSTVLMLLVTGLYTIAGRLLRVS